jgi:hypothetical protein
MVLGYTTVKLVDKLYAWQEQRAAKKAGAITPKATPIPEGMIE